MLDGLTCVYRSNVDLFFYVMGSSNENEVIVIYFVLNNSKKLFLHFQESGNNKSVFYSSVESNSHLLWFLSDWFKKHVPLETKTTRDLLAHVFLHFAPASCIYVYFKF